MDDAKYQPPPAGSEDRGHSSLAKRIVEGSTILTAVTALLFVTGWFYVEGYYESFNLDPILLDLPTYSMLVASVGPVMEAFLSILKPLIRLGAVLIPVGIYWRFSKTFRGRRLNSWLARKVPRWLFKEFVPAPRLSPAEERWMAISDRLGWLAIKISIGFVICTVLPLSGYMQGQKMGQQDLRNPSTAVTLTFDESARNGIDDALIQANANHKLMLLAQTKEVSVVFIKSTGEKLQDGLFIIPLAKLSAIHTQRVRPSK